VQTLLVGARHGRAALALHVRRCTPRLARLPTTWITPPRAGRCKRYASPVTWAVAQDGADGGHAPHHTLAAAPTDGQAPNWYIRQCVPRRRTPPSDSSSAAGADGSKPGSALSTARLTDAERLAARLRRSADPFGAKSINWTHYRQTVILRYKYTLRRPI
jgi:hypothetical protein